MNCSTRSAFFALTFALASGAAFAEQPPVDQFPDFLKPYFSAETPIGTAKLTWMWFDVYDIALWSQEYAWSYDTTFALHIRYARSFSADELTESTIKEMKAITNFTPQEEDNARAELLAVMPAVESGDTLTAVHMPKKPLILYHNGEIAGRITSLELSRQFLNIWLGPKTTHPEITRALKGLS